MAHMEESHELWHRLENESGPAYEAFKTFANLHPRERSVNEAWRVHSDNPDAAYTPAYVKDWSRDFAWADRAKARDHHFELIREKGMEKAIEEEAYAQSHEVEKLRNRFSELMTIGYTRAMEWLEDSEWTRANLRSGDVVKLIELHLKAVEAKGGVPEQKVEGDWEEEEGEEDPRIREIVERVDTDTAEDSAWGDDPEREKGLPPTD